MNMVCTICGESQPTTAFRRRHRNGNRRHRQCNKCFAQYMREYRALKRSRNIETFTREIKRRREYFGVVRLVSAMLRRYGGVEGFASMWKLHFDHSQPGSRTAQDSLFALLNLIKFIDDPNS